MNLAASLRIALIALRVNALRSALAMLGVVIGVASVIVLVSISEGTKQAVEEQIASFGANLLIIRPGSSMFGGRRVVRARRAERGQCRTVVRRRRRLAHKRREQS